MRPLVSGKRRETIRRSPSKPIAFVYIIAWLLIAGPKELFPAQPEVLHASYSALVPSGAPFWIAHELGLFEKEGLQVKLVYINASPLVIAAILAGDIQASLAGVSAIVAANAQGNDVVAIAGAVNKINVSIYALPEIQKPEDLRANEWGLPEKCYEAYKAWMPEIPYVNRAEMETAIAMTPGKTKEIKVGDIVDDFCQRTGSARFLSQPV